MSAQQTMFQAPKAREHVSEYSLVGLPRQYPQGVGVLYAFECYPNCWKIGKSIAPRRRISVHLRVIRRWSPFEPKRFYLTKPHADYGENERKIHKMLGDPKQACMEHFCVTRHKVLDAMESLFGANKPINRCSCGIGPKKEKKRGHKSRPETYKSAAIIDSATTWEEVEWISYSLRQSGNWNRTIQGFARGKKNELCGLRDFYTTKPFRSIICSESI